MKNYTILTLVIAVLLVLSGCASKSATVPPAVTYTPLWTESRDTGPEPSNSKIRIHWDNTQSMMGYAGQIDSPAAKLAVELTNLSRFDERVTTYRLIPDGDNHLIWKAEDPLIVASSVLVKDKSAYTFAGDFAHGGGPLTATFKDGPTGDVNVLVTDLLEQESELDVLTTYVTNLFKSKFHQQVRIYIFESHYDGYTSYPVVVGNQLNIQTTYYKGKRPLAVVVAGQAGGVEEVHNALMSTGIKFAEFMVENQRPQQAQVSFLPGQALGANILVDDYASSNCTINLKANPFLEDAHSYSYSKITANKQPFSRLSLLGDADPATALSLGRVIWYHWSPSEDGTYFWESCDAPEGMILELSVMEPGQAIPGRDQTETGVPDITRPVWEMSILSSELVTGHAYAVQLEVVAPVAGNPLADATRFEAFDAAFAAFGNAGNDQSVLTKIPDLRLMLSALAKLDASQEQEVVGDVRIVVQAYEMPENINNIKEE